MLAPSYHCAGRASKNRNRAQERHCVADRPQQPFMVAVVPDLDHGARRHERDRAVFPPEAAFHVPRLPRMVFLVLGDTARVFARRAHGCAIRNAGAVFQTIEKHEPQRAADRRIGAHAGSKHIIGRVNASFCAIGPLTRMTMVGPDSAEAMMQPNSGQRALTAATTTACIPPCIPPCSVDCDFFRRDRHFARRHVAITASGFRLPASSISLPGTGSQNHRQTIGPAARVAKPICSDA